MTPEASIVICTFDRPCALADALRSCVRGAMPGGLTREIIVADNSRDGYAEYVVRAVAAETGTDIPLRSVRASPPNISIARNAGIAAARAPVIAFLDDDEIDHPPRLLLGLAYRELGRDDRKARLRGGWSLTGRRRDSARFGLMARLRFLMTCVS
jgi:glycosyltransferase involved in cell wall biosynthesis